MPVHLTVLQFINNLSKNTGLELNNEKYLYFDKEFKMTKKDYELIAGTFRSFYSSKAYGGDIEVGARLGVQDLAEGLAYDLARDNPKFDRQKFLKACGINDS